MAPLSTRDCLCNPEVTFCPDLIFSRILIGSRQGYFITRFYETQVINQERYSGPFGASNMRTGSSAQTFATDYDSFLEALNSARNGSIEIPEITLAYIDEGWQDQGDAPWWDLRTRSKAGKVVIIAPLMGAGLDASMTETGVSYSNSTIIKNPVNPFASWSNSATASANMSALSDKIQEFLDTSTSVEYLNDNYPGYEHQAPLKSPGNIYNTNDLGGTTPGWTGLYYASYRDTDDPQKPGHAGGWDTGGDYHYGPVSVTNQRVFTSSATAEGYQGLGMGVTVGSGPTDLDDGLIATEQTSGVLGGNSPPSTSGRGSRFWIYDLNRINPYDPAIAGTTGAQVYKGGTSSYVRQRNQGANREIHSLLGVRFVQPNESTWFQTNTLVNMIAPFSYDTSRWRQDAVVLSGANPGTYNGCWYQSWWIRASGSGAWGAYTSALNFQSVPGAVAASDLMISILDKVADGTYGMINTPRNSVGGGSMVAPHGGYVPGFTGGVYPSPIPGSNLCVPTTFDHVDGNDYVTGDYGINVSGVSTSTAKLTTPTIVVERPTGSGDVVFWDYSKAASWGDGNVLDELSAIGGLYKNNLCKLIRGQQSQQIGGGISESTTSIASHRWPINSYPFTGQLTEADISRLEDRGIMSTETPIEMKLTGGAIDKGIGPTVSLQLSSSGTIRWLWQSFNIKSYLETPTYDEESGYTEEEYQDWQGFVWCKSAAYQLSQYNFPQYPVQFEADTSIYGHLPREDRFQLSNELASKVRHNQRAAAIYGAPSAALTVDSSPYTPTTEAYDTFYTGTTLETDGQSISDVIANARAMRIYYDIYQTNYRPAAYLNCPESRQQECTLYWSTVREDGNPFRDEYLPGASYTKYGRNEHKDNQDDISRYYEEFNADPLPMIFIMDKMFAPLTVYRFDGETPELYGLMEDFVEVSNWPELGPSIRSFDFSASNDVCQFQLGYGMLINGADVPLGVNMADSLTRYAPLFPSFWLHSKNTVGGGIELLFEPTDLDPGRFDGQSQYTRA